MSHHLELCIPWTASTVIGLLSSPAGRHAKRLGRESLDRLSEVIHRFVEDLAGRLDGRVGHQASSRAVT